MKVAQPYHAERSARPPQYSVAASAPPEQVSVSLAFWAATSGGRKFADTRYSGANTKVRSTELNG